jgi:hypothetical protein
MEVKVGELTKKVTQLEAQLLKVRRPSNHSQFS